MAGRGRGRGGGDCESHEKRVMAELFVWAAEALHPQVVDEGDIAPGKGGERKREGGCLRRSEHGRFGIGARTQQGALPQAREGKRERIDAPSARAASSNQANILGLIAW